MITNLKTYVKTHDLCRQTSETTLLWLYLEEVGDDLRIVNHDWMGWEMNWDGSGVEPLIVSAPTYGERVTRREMEAEIRRVYCEHETPQDRRRRDREAACI